VPGALAAVPCVSAALRPEAPNAAVAVRSPEAAGLALLIPVPGALAAAVACVPDLQPEAPVAAAAVLSPEAAVPELLVPLELTELRVQAVLQPEELELSVLLAFLSPEVEMELVPAPLERAELAKDSLPTRGKDAPMARPLVVVARRPAVLRVAVSPRALVLRESWHCVPDWIGNQ
jgi:hypothetical protein